MLKAGEIVNKFPRYKNQGGTKAQLKKLDESAST
jgi:hypothetical protein